MAAISNLRPIVCLLLLVFCITENAFPQNITNYTFSAGTSTFSALSGATEPGGSGATRDDNDTTYPNIPIGFDFWYMGQRYTTVSASTNGWFTFGNTIAASAPTNNLSASGTRPVIAPLWDDLSTFEGTQNFLEEILGIWSNYGTFSYKTEGTVGSRTLTLQWYRMQWSRTASGYTVSFQAKLYEANGNIEFNYGTGTNFGNGTVNAASASVGITGTATDAGNFLSLNNIGATPTVSSTSETTNIAAKPDNNRLFTFDPIEVAAPSNLTFTGVGTTGITLNWTDNSGANEIGFVIYRSTNATTGFTYVATTGANVTSYYDTNLSANTTYYYRVYALRENLSAAVTGNKATLANCNGVGMLQVSSANIIGHYKLNGNASDFYNNNNGTLRNSPTPTLDRFDQANSAYNFNGTNQYISTANSYTNPNNFTTSIWFKTTTVAGGSLLGFTSSQTGVTGNHDRHLYMGVDGRIYFGDFGGSVKTVNSGTPYNDGKWHMATATMSSAAGITLYIDGVAITSDATATSGENYTGYWRMACQEFNAGWPSTPSASYFNGALDDAFIFNRVLTTEEIQKLYSAPYGVQNNGPVCVGTTLQLVGPTIAGAQYSWTGPNGFTSALQNPSFAYTLASAGTYILTVNAGGCTDVAGTKVVSSTVAGQWTGNGGINWATAASWCNGTVPTAAVNVTIPAGLVNYPTVSSTAVTNNITIASGASVSVTDMLTISGAITNNGTFNVSNGGITLNGTTAQVIPANVFSSNLIKNFTLNNTAGATLNGNLRLTGILTASAGIFNTNGYLTLASDANTTANVAPVAATASIRGQVKVERYVRGGSINPYRTYRMLSSPVYDNTTSFINSNIEGNRSAKFSQLIDDMIISGAGGVANGFDDTHNNQAGAWTYNAGYTTIPNINTPVNAGKGMYVFYRGNRDNFTAKTNAPFIDPESTVIDFDGILNQQDVTVSLAAGYNLLGNPYASTIDWDSANWGTDKVNVNNAIWIWRPSSRSYATYINGVGVMGGSKYIGSGQAFFVSATASGTIKFKESIKTSGTTQPPVLLMAVPNKEENFTKSTARTFSNNMLPHSVLRVVMKPLASYGEDEAAVVFKESSNIGYDAEDAPHFDGEVVNIATLADGNGLAVNFLPVSVQPMEIAMNVTAAASGSYFMQFNLGEYSLPNSLKLKDNYLGKTIPITQDLIYNFNVDKTNAQTFGTGRFSIMVQSVTVLPLNLISFTAKKQNFGVLLTWQTSYETNNKLYKLYRASNDGNYVFISDVLPKGAGTYTFLDKGPLPGYNYYKLIQVDADGKTIEVGIATVNFIAEQNVLAIYPNPAIEKFTIRTDHLAADKFKLSLYDIRGKNWGAYFMSKEQLNKGYEIGVAALSPGLFFVKIEEIDTGKIIAIEKMVKN